MICKGKSFGHQVVSFCFVPDVPGTNHLQHTLTLTKDGFLDVNRPPVPAVHCWSPRGEMTAAVGNGMSYRYRPDRSLPENASNEDPWQLMIEHSAAYSPPNMSTVAASLPESQAYMQVPDIVDINVEPPSDRLREPRGVELPNNSGDDPGRIPFPSLNDAFAANLTRTSSLSASREASEEKREKSPAAILSRRRAGMDRPEGPISARASRPNSRGPVSKKGIPGTSTPASTAPVAKVPKPLKDVHKAFQSDISEIMKARVLQGYGLDSVSIPTIHLLDSLISFLP